MQKINFQNLPSTATPINATNLNAIQTNVEDVFNGSKPMGNVVVDSIRSKNMLNPANLIYNINYNETTQGFEQTPNWILSGFIPIKINTSYIYSHSLGTSAGVIDYFDENKTYLGQVNPETITSPFQITNANAKYILVKMWNSNIQNETWQQLEEGTTATTFTPYENLDTQIIPITPTFTSSVSNNDLDYECVRIGKYVFLKLNTITFNTSGSTHDETFITGLPKSEKEHIFLLNTGWKNMANDSLLRFKILPDGTIKSHYALLNAGSDVSGGILIYRTVD